jgi:hypothetical protein
MEAEAAAASREGTEEADEDRRSSSSGSDVVRRSGDGLPALHSQGQGWGRNGQLGKEKTKAKRRGLWVRKNTQGESGGRDPRRTQARVNSDEGRIRRRRVSMERMQIPNDNEKKGSGARNQQQLSSAGAAASRSGRRRRR